MTYTSDFKELIPLLTRNGGGDMSTIQKKINIGGEPHQLSYINSDEADILRRLGGSGRPVNGVPAYNGLGVGDPDAPSMDQSPAEQAAQEALEKKGETAGPQGVFHGFDLGATGERGGWMGFGAPDWESLDQDPGGDTTVDPNPGPPEMEDWEYFHEYDPLRRLYPRRRSRKGGGGLSNIYNIEDDSPISDYVNEIRNQYGLKSIGYGKVDHKEVEAPTITLKDGGISSPQKQMNIGGEPHRLSYINSDEANILRQLGGSGRNVQGIPAYDWEDSEDDDADYWAEQADITSTEELDEAAMSTGFEDFTASEEDEMGMRGWGLDTFAPKDWGRSPGALGGPDLDYLAKKEQEKIQAQKKATSKIVDDLIRESSKLHNTPGALEALRKKGQERVDKLNKEKTNIVGNYYELTDEEIADKVAKGKAFENTNEHGLTTTYGPADPHGFKGTYDRGVMFEGPENLRELQESIGIGWQGGMHGPGQEFESYAEAAQAVIDDILAEQAKEKSDYYKEHNISFLEQQAYELGWKEPPGGWKSRQLHEPDVFTSGGLGLISGGIRNKAMLLGRVINELQRLSGRGELGQEKMGITDYMTYRENLERLTGNREALADFHMETYQGKKEKGDLDYIGREKSQRAYDRKQLRQEKRLELLARLAEKKKREAAKKALEEKMKRVREEARK